MEILGVGRKAVYSLIHRKVFPAIRINSVGYRIPKERASMPGCISSIECLSANAGRRQTKTLAEVVLRSRLAERKEGAAVSDKEATTMTVRAMGAFWG